MGPGTKRRPERVDVRLPEVDRGRPLSRRDLFTLAGGVTLLPRAFFQPSFFQTRGVVLVPDDLTLSDWPDRARRAGLTTIGLHHGVMPQVVIDFVGSLAGRRFLERCRALGIAVEYELHAMQQLLPRELFGSKPDWFRMNDKGERTPDANLCVSSTDALDTVADNALALSRILRPTTGRFFLWGDDGKPWCRCPRCRELSDSDQALVMENHLLQALETIERGARLAHLAYANTLEPPRTIKPRAGVFLEYAPINRRYDVPYASQTGPAFRDALDALDRNLAVFGTERAQVLEYWLDVSLASKYKKPAVKLAWNDSASPPTSTCTGRGTSVT